MSKSIKTYEISKYAAVVPMAIPSEQIALNNDIKDNGLREPVVLWRNKIVDGRCRQIACVNAGVEIRTKSLDWDMEETEVIRIVKSLNTRRNLSNTQKAIIAYRDALRAKITMKESADSWGINKNTMTLVKFLDKKRPAVLDPLFSGSKININGSMTDSLAVIARFIKKEGEIDKCDNMNQWNPDSQIKTEAGKEWFAKNIDDVTANRSEAIRMMVELSNYKFKDNS